MCFLILSTNAGQIIGVGIGYFYFDDPNILDINWRLYYYIVVIIVLVAFLLIVLFLRETPLFLL